MIREVIQGGAIPRTELPYSPAIRAGDYLFVSGQASVDAQGKIVPDTFAGELRRSFANLVAVLHEADLELRHVVQVRSYVARQEDLPEYNRLYTEFFSEPYPARTTLMGCLGTLLKFEVDAVAYRGDETSR